jgi:hypothetical protein
VVIILLLISEHYSISVVIIALCIAAIINVLKVIIIDNSGGSLFTGSSEHKKHHEIDKKFKPSSETLEIIKNGYKGPISHLKSDANYGDDFSRKLNMNNQLKYKKTAGDFKRQLHWGQLKLFLSELEFLTMVMKQYNTNTDNTTKNDNTDSKLPIYFIYAGAASGNHIVYLQKLFPMIYFELYDPLKFAIKDTEKIKTHVQFFTDADAEYWSKRKDIYLVFCSDIRSDPPSDENIVNNMNMQLKWWDIMKPELSMFKFRLLWTKGIIKYPEGDIYLQAYSGWKSSETRLIVKKHAKLIEYNNTEYESACFCHNTVNRIKHYNNGMSDLSIEKDGIDNCYDCTSFIHIAKEYLLSNIGIYDKSKNIMDFINEIQKNIIRGERTIKSQTEKQISDMVDMLKRKKYVKCENRKCKVCMSGADILKNKSDEF